MSSSELLTKDSGPEKLSNGVVSGVLIRIGLFTVHAAAVLGRPNDAEISQAEALISAGKNPEQRLRTYTLISSVLERFGMLTFMYDFSLRSRLHVGGVSTGLPGNTDLTRDEEIFQDLIPGKIVSRESILRKFGIGIYTFTAHLRTMREKHFPNDIVVTVDQGLLLLGDSADFLAITDNYFSKAEQQSPTRVSVFMYLILKYGAPGTPFQMRTIFEKLEQLGLPLGNKVKLIEYVKKPFSLMGYILVSDGKGMYTLKEQKKD